MRLKPIGVIHTPFTEALGTPIQPDAIPGSEGQVEVFPEYVAGLKDLDACERIWLIFWFDRAAPAKMVVVPYMDTVPRGLFATRAPCRPNPIGISPVRLIRIEDNILHVAEVDILDGTPLLDIKPYVPKFDCREARAGWLEELAARACETRADNRFYKSS